MRARITCWGTRGTSPAPGPHTFRYGGHTACVEVRFADGTRVVFDAGSGLRLLGHTLDAANERASARSRTRVPLILTHRHSDHVIGLAPFAAHVAGTHDIDISCPGVEVEALRALVMQQLSEPLFPHIDGVLSAVRVSAFDARGERTIGETGRVLALPAHHPGGASILRAADADGLLLAYAPDNELHLDASDDLSVHWRAMLAEALHGVPVLLHDATYTHDELPAHRGWGHSSAEEATRFAIMCNARMLLLFHHHPDRRDEAVDAMVARCAALAAAAGSTLRVAAAADGGEYDIA